MAFFSSGLSLQLARFTAIGLLVLIPIFTSAQKNVFRFALTVDQDYFLTWLKLPNNDQNYTMGMGLFFSNTKWARSWPYWPLRKFGNWVSFKKQFGDDYTENASFQVGVSAFTPLYLGDNMTDSLYFMMNDRPFASLTFLSLKYNKSGDYWNETTQLVLGVLGTGIAREVQTYMHREHIGGSTRAIPDGWRYQIGDGGCPTGLLGYKIDKLLNTTSNSLAASTPLVQWIGSAEARVGYYTDLMVGGAFRFGKLDPANWVNFDSYQLNHASAFVKEERKLQWETYLTGSIKPRAVFYNALMMGQGNDTFHVLSGGEISHFVTEFNLGIGGTVIGGGKKFSANGMLYVAARTPEFTTDYSDRWHSWVGLQIVLSWLSRDKNYKKQN